MSVVVSGNRVSMVFRGGCPVCGAEVASVSVFRSSGLLRRRASYTVVLEHPEGGSRRICFTTSFDSRSADPDERRLFDILEEVFSVPPCDPGVFIEVTARRARSAKTPSEAVDRIIDPDSSEKMFAYLTSVYGELMGMVLVVVEKAIERRRQGRAGGQGEK